MATASELQYDLSRDPTFVKRVEIQACTLARDVYNEGSGVTAHPTRATLAKAVILDPVGWAGKFVVGVAVQRTDATSGTDADIYSALSFLWNLYAGV